MAEQPYGTKKDRKDSVDWILSDGEAAIFIECKAKRLSWKAKSTLDDLTALESDIDRMADAVIQVYKTIIDYMENRYTHFPFVAGRKIYPIIVTLENWHMFGPVMLEKLKNSVVSKISAAEIAADALESMPYSVWAIEEFEVGVQVMKTVGVRQVLDGKLSDSEMQRWEWQPYLRKCFSKCFPAKRLFDDEYEAIFRKVIS